MQHAVRGAVSSAGAESKSSEKSAPVGLPGPTEECSLRGRLGTWTSAMAKVSSQSQSRSSDRDTSR